MFIGGETRITFPYRPPLPMIKAFSRAASSTRAAAAAAGFLVAFYLLLVGSKVVLAALVAAGRTRLSAGGLRRAHQVAAVALIATGVLLVVELAPAALAA